MPAPSTPWAPHVEQVVEAPQERTFSAFVEPDELARWWGPAGFTVPSVELDARDGGRYRITMQPPGGEAFHLRGTFHAVEAPRRLVYTFEWEEPTPDDRETVVTVTFVGDGGRTTVAVDQGAFATEERLALHEAGWTETLERLARHLGPRVPPGR